MPLTELLTLKPYVRSKKSFVTSRESLAITTLIDIDSHALMPLIISYDLDLDNKLSEETTVLVENYTVGYLSYSIVIDMIFLMPWPVHRSVELMIYLWTFSYLTEGLSKSVKNDSGHLSVCFNRIWWMSSLQA